MIYIGNIFQFFEGSGITRMTVDIVNPNDTPVANLDLFSPLVTSDGTNLTVDDGNGTVTTYSNIGIRLDGGVSYNMIALDALQNPYHLKRMYINAVDRRQLTVPFNVVKNDADGNFISKIKIPRFDPYQQGRPNFATELNVDLSDLDIYLDGKTFLRFNMDFAIRFIFELGRIRLYDIGCYEKKISKN